ncbi:virulence factor TspB C-terminal domain-related protein [Comamonas sp. 26]|uniref:virulence factor TspB C-terminal domain-related protein n=1 Tax=Comamonas sp. 26 TaxID=2035201 RepID=UPI00119825F4|nr:virulence factor TspB C-terminal domain-related protein [Comamonas sp. 26]
MNTRYYLGGAASDPNYASQSEACNSWAPAASGYSRTVVSGRCVIKRTADNYEYANFSILSFTQCPANSIATSGVCNCNTGYSENGNQCVLNNTNTCNGLSDFCSGLKGGKINLEGKGTASPPGCSADSARPNCAMGCAAEQVGIGVSYKTSDGSWMTSQEYRVTGGTCTLPQPSDVPQKKESDCAGSVGDVNGVRTCVPNQAATGDKKTESAKNPDGTTSNKETSTTCDKGVCTTTTVTTTKDSSGATTSTSSSTSSSSQSSYCASNKSSAVCAATNGDKNPDGKDGTDKGDGKCEGEDCEDKPGKFEGTCASGFTCEGDGISCALAKEVHTRNCQIDALKDGPLYKAWETVKDLGTKNVTTDLPGNKRFDISVTDRDDFLGSGSCPADRVIDFWFGSLALPFSALCPWLQMLGYVNVIFASIAGALIIIRRQS